MCFLGHFWPRLVRTTFASWIKIGLGRNCSKVHMLVIMFMKQAFAFRGKHGRGQATEFNDLLRFGTSEFNKSPRLQGNPVGFFTFRSASVNSRHHYCSFHCLPFDPSSVDSMEKRIRSSHQIWADSNQICAQAGTYSWAHEIQANNRNGMKLVRTPL